LDNRQPLILKLLVDNICIPDSLNVKTPSIISKICTTYETIAFAILLRLFFEIFDAKPDSTKVVSLMHPEVNDSQGWGIFKFVARKLESYIDNMKCTSPIIFCSYKDIFHDGIIFINRVYYDINSAPSGHSFKNFPYQHYYCNSPTRQNDKAIHDN